MNANTLIQQNIDHREKIQILQYQIEMLNREILKNEGEIFKNCDHKWVVEYDYDRSSSVCENCGLTNNEYLYVKNY